MAVTLPYDVVDGLRAVHPDLARAIVAVFEGRKPRGTTRRRPEAQEDAALLSISDRTSIIVVNRALSKGLHGINPVPLGDGRALLALEPGCGLADLEAAVTERLQLALPNAPERRFLSQLRTSIRGWRREGAYRFRSRSIIVVERRRMRRVAGQARQPAKRK